MHWTYQKFDTSSDLEQGDFLSCTDELKSILADVHPHFCDAKYLGFVVSSQSCDLVRRPDCKARYVTIAVVRSLRATLPRLLEQIDSPVTTGIFRKSARGDARQFLARLLNQNEQAQGLFYLHPEAAIGLGEAGVALLRVTVSLRSQHYDALVAARTGRLETAFQAKYGWLLGNLYSRVASPDWSDQPHGKAQAESLISEFLEPKGTDAGPWWLDDELVDAGQASGVNFVERRHDELLAELKLHEPLPVIDKVTDEVMKEVCKVVELDVDTTRKIRNRLKNNGTLRKLIRAKP